MSEVVEREGRSPGCAPTIARRGMTAPRTSSTSTASHCLLGMAPASGADRRRRPGPAGIRLLRQAGGLRLLDRGLRPVARGIRRRHRDGALLARRPRLGLGRPRPRAALPGADRAARQYYDCVPFLPGYRWHWVARIWRRPVMGELFMATSSRWGFKQISREANVTPGPLPAWFHRPHLERFRPRNAARDPAPLPVVAAGGARARRRSAR